MMMYLYSFTLYTGSDRVFFCANKGGSYAPGTLIRSGNDIFLVLGEDISFQELYTYHYLPKEKFQVYFSTLLSERTMQLLHRMVYERYSSYKNVIKLFLDPEVEKLIDKASKTKVKNLNIDFMLGKEHIFSEKGGQILLIFSDLWTFTNTIDQEQVGGVFLSSLDTQNKKNKHRRSIKTGSEKLIFSTGSEIFQDFHALEKIYLIEPQKRYYASQQDPRYKVNDVAKKIAELYDAELVIIDSEKLVGI